MSSKKDPWFGQAMSATAVAMIGALLLYFLLPG
jgi:hypothetical protein